MDELLRQLQEQRNAETAKIEAILNALKKEKRVSTEAEQATMDSAEEALKKISADIDRVTRQLAREKTTTAQGRVPNPQAPARSAVSVVSPGRSLKAFRVRSAAHPFAPFENRAEAIDAAYKTGKWMQALLGNNEARAWCQEHGVFSAGTNQVIHREMFDQSAPRVYNAGQDEASLAAGGALVPDEMERAIIDLREEYGAIRRLARIAPMSSDTLIRPRRTGGLTAYFVGETAAFTQSTKGWDNVSLVAKLAGVLAKFSWQLGEDAIISIADDLVSESAYAFAVLEDTVGFSGTGTAAHGGIVGIVTKFANDAATLAGVVNAAATHDNFSEIDGDDIDNLVAKLPLYARRNARFYCGPACKALAFDPLLRAAGGNTQGDVANGMPARYLGYGIEEAVGLPNNTAGNYDESPMILFGDMSAAMTLGNRRGITVQLLNELYAANGQIGVIAHERFDINVHDIGDASTVGPIVALHGETS